MGMDDRDRAALALLGAAGKRLKYDNGVSNW